MPHWGDPTAVQTPIVGISEFGEWTSTSSTGSPNEYNADNVYARVPWGDINPSGAQITATVSRIEQRSAMSPALRDSFLNQATMQLVIGGLSDSHLTNIRRALGLPDASHTGDLTDSPPTSETLLISGRDIGTVTRQLYLKAFGPLGARYFYAPRAQVADIGALLFNREGYQEPGVTFDLLENDDTHVGWYVDETS